MFTHLSNAHQITYTTVGENRGNARVWIEGIRLAIANFVKGGQFDLVESKNAIQLLLRPEGEKKISGRKRNNQQIPIIDLNVSRLKGQFARRLRVGMKLRVTFIKNVISISLHAEELAKIVREQRFIQNWNRGQITEGSLCTGGGVSTAAFHEEISKHIKSKLSWAVDAEMKYLQVAAKNCSAISDKTRFAVAKLEELEQEFYEPVDIMSVSLPCSPYSKAGKAKNGIPAGEHPEITAMFGLTNAIKVANPAIIPSENVVDSKNSDLYGALKTELKRLGYSVFERVFAAADTPTFESRERYWFVAISEGLAKHFEWLLPKKPWKLTRLSDFLETNVPESEWQDHQYLKDKAERDKLKPGSFHKRQLLTGDETKCGCIGKYYAKRRGTEPFVVREDNKERLLTVNEHAKMKEVPVEAVEGVCTTTAHAILGQSVDYIQAKSVMLSAIMAVKMAVEEISKPALYSCHLADVT